MSAIGPLSLAVAALLAAHDPAVGVPRPVGTWGSFDAGDLDDDASPPFAALVAGAGEASSGAPPTTVALHPAIARRALSRPLVNTAHSFSAAAWVRLDDCGVPRAVAVAQGGLHASAFVLGYVAGNFAFTTALCDQPGAGERHLWAATEPVQQRWTHLVGVFDARAGQLRIYVDGSLAGSAPAPPMWAAHEATTVARGRLGGAWSPPWPGDVEDVRIYDGALTDAVVRAIFLQQPEVGEDTP